MKRKRLIIIIGIILVSLIIYYNLQWSSNTPSGAIRRYVFSKIDKLESFTLSLGKSGYIDGTNLEKQYFVNGVFDKESGGGPLCFFYLKKDNSGKWYVSSCGSGP